MKMVRAIVRPEKADAVVSALEGAGFPSMTRVDVFGRGRQLGIKIGDIHYDELPKVMLMVAVKEEEAARVTEVISTTAKTGQFGDGKIFTSSLDEVYTVRTGETGL